MLERRENVVKSTKAMKGFHFSKTFPLFSSLGVAKLVNENTKPFACFIAKFLMT